MVLVDAVINSVMFARAYSSTAACFVRCWLSSMCTTLYKRISVLIAKK